MDKLAVTLELPEPLYRAARQVADATGQPLEMVLQDSIAHALPPLDDVTPDEATELAALSILDDASLWREARRMMSDDQQAALHLLLDLQAAGELSATAQQRLDALIDLYGRLTIRKAHAHLLLARRGYHVALPDAA